MRVSSLVRCSNPELSVFVEYFVVRVSSCKEPFFNCVYHLINGADGYATAEQVNTALSSAPTMMLAGPCKICAVAVEEDKVNLQYFYSSFCYLDTVLQLVGC